MFVKIASVKTQICRFNPLASLKRGAAKQFRYEAILCNGTAAVRRLANTGKQCRVRGLSRGKFLPAKSTTRVDFSFSLSRSEKGNKKQLQNVTVGQRCCLMIGQSSLN